MELLSTYKKIAGQKINREKTNVFFSKSTSLTLQQVIKDTLGVVKIKQFEKYLGLPSLVGRQKKANFNYTKEKVWRKLQGWETKLLSQVGREILVKVVAQAIPMYDICCFKLPMGQVSLAVRVLGLTLPTARV